MRRPRERKAEKRKKDISDGIKKIKAKRQEMLGLPQEFEDESDNEGNENSDDDENQADINNNEEIEFFCSQPLCNFKSQTSASLTRHTIETHSPEHRVRSLQWTNTSHNNHPVREGECSSPEESVGEDLGVRSKSVCQKCGLKMSRSRNLKNHIKICQPVAPDLKCEYCGSNFLSLFNRLRHQKESCKQRPGLLEVSEVRTFVEQHQFTISQSQKMVQFMSSKGSVKFPTGVVRSLKTKTYKRFEDLYMTEKMTNDGKETVVTYVKDLTHFMNIVVEGRGIKSPRVAVSCDFGQDALIATISVFDINDLENNSDDPMSAGGTERTLIIGAADQVPESTFSANLLLNSKLSLHKFVHLHNFIADLKFVSILSGLARGQPTNGCPYCIGRRVRTPFVDSSGKKRFKFRFETGTLRSFQSNMEDYVLYREEIANRVSAKSMRSHNINSEPVELLPPEKHDIPSLFFITPEPLHHLLGRLLIVDWIIHLLAKKSKNHRQPLLFIIYL